MYYRRDIDLAIMCKGAYQQVKDGGSTCGAVAEVLLLVLCFVWAWLPVQPSLALSVLLEGDN